MTRRRPTSPMSGGDSRTYGHSSNATRAPVTLLAAFLVCLVAPDVSNAGTDWPAFQERLEPGPSQSSVKCELPAEVNVVAPTVVGFEPIVQRALVAA